MSIVTVERKILKKNDEIANENRNLFKNPKSAMTPTHFSFVMFTGFLAYHYHSHF